MRKTIPLDSQDRGNIRQWILKATGYETYEEFMEGEGNGDSINASYITEFIYYEDTDKAFDIWREEIIRLLEERRDDFGYKTMFELYKTFTNTELDGEEEFYETLYAEKEYRHNHITHKLVHFMVEDIMVYNEEIEHLK